MDIAQNRKNLILLAIITMIVVYIAVSVYGVIRDSSTGQTDFIISSTLPIVGDGDRGVPFLDRIRNFIYPPHKVIVPVEKQITIKGRVVYKDGTPYAFGLVELRSAPRTTYTDRDGYFIFQNVEDGDHTISVLSQSGQVLASCKVTINRNLEIADTLLVQVSVDTFVLEIGVDVKTLEVVLEIEQDGSGLPNGHLTIGPQVNVLERNNPGEQPQPGIPLTPEPPAQPVIPNPPPDILGGGGGGGGGIPPQPQAWALTVYSTGDSNDFHQAPSPATDINIFGSGKHIAPGMTGVYKFTVNNTANPFAVNYDIDLVETNNSLNIPMKYRLQNNNTNTYVNGDSNWHTTAEIRAVTADSSVPLVMSDSMKTGYTLEWFWDDGGINDNSFANHADEVVCTLSIIVSAQRK